jgi:hypothetical protein
MQSKRPVGRSTGIPRSGNISSKPVFLMVDGLCANSCQPSQSAPAVAYLKPLAIIPTSKVLEVRCTGEWCTALARGAAMAARWDAGDHGGRAGPHLSFLRSPTWAVLSLKSSNSSGLKFSLWFDYPRYTPNTASRPIRDVGKR